MTDSKSTKTKYPTDTHEVGAGMAQDKLERTELKPARTQKPAGEGILPKKASEDDPRRWGDEHGYDHDAWLKEQKPPHWG